MLRLTCKRLVVIVVVVVVVVEWSGKVLHFSAITAMASISNL